MKKLLASAVLLIALVAVVATTSMAATNADLIAYIKANHTISGKVTGVSAGNRVKAERYLKENPVTDEQATALIEKGNELIALMESAGVSDPAKLSQADREKFMNIAREAAAIVGLTLDFHPAYMNVYKDGVLIDTVTMGSKLAYTGNNTNLALVISSVAVIALAAGFVAKKRLANA